MTGDAGQRFQAWLRAAGLTTKYAIVRVLPVDTSDLPAAKVRAHRRPPPGAQRLRAPSSTPSPAASPDLAAIVAVGPTPPRLAAATSTAPAPSAGHDEGVAAEPAPWPTGSTR